MDFISPFDDNDPADAWKKEQGPINGDQPPHYDLGEPLNPDDTVKLWSSTGENQKLCDQLNERFRELGFLNWMVKDQTLFMNLFVGCKMTLRINRSGLNFSHKFLPNKQKPQE